MAASHSQLFFCVFASKIGIIGLFLLIFSHITSILVLL